MENDPMSRRECQLINKDMAEQIKEVKKGVDGLTVKVAALPNELRLEMANAHAELLKQMTLNQEAMLKSISDNYSGKWVETTFKIVLKFLGTSILIGAGSYFIAMMYHLGPLR